MAALWGLRPGSCSYLSEMNTLFIPQLNSSPRHKIVRGDFRAVRAHKIELNSEKK